MFETAADYVVVGALVFIICWLIWLTWMIVKGVWFTLKWVGSRIVNDVTKALQNE